MTQLSMTFRISRLKS